MVYASTHKRYTPQTFAIAVLRGLQLPVTAANVRAFVGWERAEGGHWNNQARYNPLNTTQEMPGAGNTSSQGNIKVYRSWDQGVAATVKTLSYGAYGGIRSALAQGHDPGAVANAIGRSPWGTNASLVASAIGGTPKQSVGAYQSQPQTTRAAAVPFADPAARQALLLNYVANRSSPNALLDLASGLRNLPTAPAAGYQPTAQPSASGTVGGYSVVKFDGKPVRSDFAEQLAFARQNGWKGTVQSGYRTKQEQIAAATRYGLQHYPSGPLASNHVVGHQGAVDVSDPQTLDRILRRYPGKRTLIWGGPVMGDQPHFSPNGH